MIEALLIGLVDAVAFGLYFALGIIVTVVVFVGLLIATLYWLELREKQ